MPGDRFSFAVFIGCEPDIGSADGFYLLFKLGDNFLFLRVNFVDRFEAVCGIDRRCAVFCLLGDRANMPNTTQHGKVFTEVFFYGFALARALYDDEVF